MKNESGGEAVLIIGYGNTLRGDDGVGRQLVEAVAERKLPRIRTRSVHQLVPELAEDLAACGAVIFVDASIGRSDETVSMRPIVAAGPSAASEHVMRPQSVLAYARDLFGSSPKSWLLTIPGENFEVGESLSAAARTASAAALTMIERFIQEYLRSSGQSPLATILSVQPHQNLRRSSDGNFHHND